MSIPMNFVHTIVDFWLLGPRRFFDALQTKPNRYLTPGRTFAIALLPLVAVYFAQYVLIFSAQYELPQSQGLDQGQLFALTQGQSLGLALILTIPSVVLLPLSVLVVAALETLFSRFWPVRSKGKFRSIWNFNLYYFGANFWLALLGLLSTFVGIQLGMFNMAVTWIVVGVSILPVFVAYFAYKVPGLAAINGVSYGRMLGNQLLWFFVLMMALWLVMFILLIVVMTLVGPLTPGAKV
jgi:small basic protein